MTDLLDSDGPSYDPEAYLEAADNARKAARERGEKVGPTFPVAPDEIRCTATFGVGARCIMELGHDGGHHYRGRIR